MMRYECGDGKMEKKYHDAHLWSWIEREQVGANRVTVLSLAIEHPMSRFDCMRQRSRSLDDGRLPLAVLRYPIITSRWFVVHMLVVVVVAMNSLTSRTLPPHQSHRVCATWSFCGHCDLWQVQIMEWWCYDTFLWTLDKIYKISVSWFLVTKKQKHQQIWQVTNPILCNRM